MDADATGAQDRPTIPGWAKAAAAAAIVVTIVVLAVGPGRSMLTEVLVWINGLGALGALVFFVAYVLATILFVPGGILTIGAGFAFGLWAGTALVSVSSVVGALLAFLIGRRFLHEPIRSRLTERPRLLALMRAIDEEGFRVVLLARLVPLFPFNLLNYAFGLTNVDWKKYTLASWIGMLPGTIAYVYAGAAASSLARAATEQSPPGWATYGLWGLGAVAVVGGTVLVTRRAKRELDAIMSEKEDAKEPVFRSEPSATTPVRVDPMDRFNEELVELTHPSGHVNPSPDEPYNLVVIGAGTAGLVSAAGAAMLGARVALIEEDLFGGDCLVRGCVPSKALLRSANALHDARRIDRFGGRIDGELVVDFPALMERMRRLRSRVAEHDAVSRFQNLGVDVYLGRGHFLDAHCAQVAGAKLAFRKAVVATGTHPAIPPIDGLQDVPYLTNESIFSLTDLPRHLLVIGGGPVGCELAQAFARFGSSVTVLERGDRLLTKEDEAASQRVAAAFAEDGIEVICNASVTSVEATLSGLALCYERNGKLSRAEGSHLLVATGREPNVEGLGLEKAGVNFDPRRGVQVDDHMRTSRRHIFAAGDVASALKFTHVADAQAKIVLRNALFFGSARFSDVVVPRVTYTDPEIAHVGLTEAEARDAGLDVDVIGYDFDDLDRAIVDGEGGMSKVVLRSGTDEIIGATVVARHAGEMIGEYTVSMSAGRGLAALADVVHPYPTQAEGLKKPADEYNRGRLKPWMKRWLQTFFRWRR